MAAISVNRMRIGTWERLKFSRHLHSAWRSELPGMIYRCLHVVKTR